uniref:Uncharacterized protein n=1 Tax=Chromera velia CCMP2878 TaxID=1169474 RepID=A0A0G4GSZ9_9ALVE|eukprot:Cvel_5161.t1-p1 / transcript=Cvel_5161.t1 / gene=Cvel_5161 / organism=Chromera_velia_CCMP2878 / gene_product=hypothetical protein / transcript_product=hypothetical protein / location=Cvel_scaffold237:6467-7174(-) / protein_length=236 / sequence_SO=supercontig / SO=protein_coding / is_pseudo=false
MGEEAPKPQRHNFFPTAGKEIDLEKTIEKELGKIIPDQQALAVLDKLRNDPREAAETTTAIVDILGIVAALVLSIVVQETFVDPEVCSSLPNGPRLCNIQVCLASFSVVMCCLQIGVTSILHGWLKDLQEDEIVHTLGNYTSLFRNVPIAIMGLIIAGLGTSLIVRVSIQSSQYEDPYWGGEAAEWWSHPAGLTLIIMFFVLGVLPFSVVAGFANHNHTLIKRKKYGVPAKCCCCR